MTKQFDFATLGENMLRLSPPGNERIAQAHTLDMKMGGAESNVAIALARLGFKTTWLSRLPDNALGQRMLADMQAYGLDTSGVRMAANERLGTYYIEFGAAPRPNRVIYDRANSAASNMQLSDVDFDLIASANWFHATGITPALSDNCAQITHDTVQFARAQGLQVSFDVNYRALLWTPAQAARTLEPIMQHCHVVFVAHRDAISLFNASADAPTAAQELRARLGCALLVMTVAENGAVAAQNDALHVVPQPFEVPHPVDRIGAGDAFDAGVIAGHLRGLSIEESLRYGHAMSALKMTIPGDHALVSPEEVAHLLAGDKRASVR